MINKIGKFQFVGEFCLKKYATVRRGFFFVFSGAIFGIRWFESFCWLNGSISKKTFFRVSWVRVLAEKGWICFGRDYL